MDSNPIHHPSPAKTIKCSFLDYIQLLMIGRAGPWTRTPSATPLQPKNKMLIFGLRSISGDWPGWSMDSNPICHPSPAKKIKCSFLDYIQLLMIWCLAGLVNGLEPHLPPLPSKKIKCSFLDYVQLLMIGRAGWWTQTPFTTTLQPKKWNVHFWITFNFRWWLGWSMDSNPFATPLQPKK